MTIGEAIQQLQEFAARDLKGADAELVLFDRSTSEVHRTNPDADVFDFEILRGSGEVVIEFN